MSSIPSNLSRVPNLLVSRLGLSGISRTSTDILRVSQQLTSGLEFQRPSEDTVRATTIGVLDDRLERSTQIKRNLSQASGSLGLLDTIFNEATNSANQARSIASQQSGTGSSTTERSAQASVVDQVLAGLFSSGNTKNLTGYLLGGSQTSSPPFQEFPSGYRYTGFGSGILTDLGQSSTVPVTLGPGNPLAKTATQSAGNVDYNPVLTPETRLADLSGSRGLGVAKGTVQFSVNGGSPVSVDLSGADTVEDVTTRLTNALRDYETTSGTTVLGPAGVGVSGGAISIDVAGGTPAPTIRFNDTFGGTSAQDLGLSSATPFDFSSTSALGADTNPKLTPRTPISALSGITGALGQLKVNNGGRTTLVDLSGAQTVGEVLSKLSDENLGIRADINSAGTGLDITNQVAGGRGGALSIEEVSTGNQTATRLGIRTFDSGTRTADLNFGKGVQIVDGKVDPVTGNPNPSLNVDFKITLGDPAQTTITVDLRPQDLTNVQTVLDRINSEAQSQLAAAGLPSTAFSAGLSTSTNGIVLRQDSTYTNALKVSAENNSPAAEQLGLLNGTFDTTSASLVGQDRAKVRVDSLFSDLIDLRDGLRRDDVNGISLAYSSLGISLDQLSETRGLVGAYSRRVDEATSRETDRVTLDTQSKSTLQDTDYTSASARYSLLQTQLEASLKVTAASQRQSLLDYI